MELTEIQKKLQGIQSELVCNKGKFNKFGNYKYRSCEDILDAVKTLLIKYNCVLDLRDDLIEIAGRVYVKATATISAGNEFFITSAYAREQEVKTGMDQAQITGACSSYARKYALNGLFLIDDVQDADTQDNTQNIVEPVEEKPASLCECGKKLYPVKGAKDYYKCYKCGHFFLKDGKFNKVEEAKQ